MTESGGLRKAYRTILGDHFPPGMEISFVMPGGERQTLVYEKVGWEIDGDTKGLRYGENPDQEAALYKPVNGRLKLGDVHTIQLGRWLASDTELLQSGKHPGKINITDADAALGMLRYFPDKPTVAIMKHNNPSGVARREILTNAYIAARMADRIAAYGGTVALNRTVDMDTANEIAESYLEVVVAPEFEQGVMGVFEAKKDLRVMRIGAMERLQDWDGAMVPEFKTLIDGGQIVQWPYVPKARTKMDLRVVTARQPTESEYRDMLFGWLVEAGVTSNSVLYVRDETTLGIGTGQQDRLYVASDTVAKAQGKMADRIAWETYRKPFVGLDPTEQGEIMKSPRVREVLKGASMVSDGFFPFADGAEAGIRAGVTAIVQPGGSKRDDEVIAACNGSNVAMAFTGQRSFRH